MTARPILLEFYWYAVLNRDRNSVGMLWFKRTSKTSLHERLEAMHHWLHGEDGQSLLNSERRLIEQELNTVFGYHACQMTIAPGSDLLDQCQVSHTTLLSPSLSQSIGKPSSDSESLVVTDPFHWPVCPGSLDLVLLHHVVECSDRPHRLLSEAARTIIPGGKLMLVGFNPKSLLSGLRWVSPKYRALFRDSHFIGAGRMRDWLTLLGFYVETTTYGSYLHPLDNHAKGLTKELAEQRCRQWQLPFGSFYLMVATQETPGITPVRSSWANVRKRFVPRPMAGASSCTGVEPGESFE